MDQRKGTNVKKSTLNGSIRFIEINRYIIKYYITKQLTKGEITIAMNHQHKNKPKEKKN
jgi:hypothetical protein